MPRFFSPISVVTAVALAFGTIGAGGAEPSRPDTSRLVLITAEEVLAYGPGGTLTRNSAEAFVEALEFILAELGQPTTFGSDLRQEIHQALAAEFGNLPLDDQILWSGFRDVWTLTRQSWTTLPFHDKQAFARGVLVTAFGEDVANRALGSADTKGGYFEDEVNDFCARHGGC